MKKTIVHFIRHGQTSYNLEKKIQGSVNIELSDIGKKQAESMSSDSFLPSYDMAYHSSLSRSKKTLEIILDKNNLKLETKLSDLLIERSYGIFEGLHDDTIKERYPETFHKWKEDENTDIEGSEKIENVVNRILKFIKLVVDNEYNQIMAVTHSGVLFSLYKFVKGSNLSIRPNEIYFPNCCSVYLDIYHIDKEIKKLEFHFEDKTYIYSGCPTEVVIPTA